MKNIKPILIPAFGVLTLSCQQKESRPNILYVFPDQFRNSAMGFWENDNYKGAQRWTGDPVHTPNLDRFADESLVLTRAMSTCPLSSPYRGMFLTGMYPERSGIMSNCMALRPENTLREDAVCISDVFAQNGYECAYIGKLHAEVPMKNDPENPGHYVSDRTPEWDAYTPAERRHGFSWWYSYGTFDEHKNPHYWDTEGKRHDPKQFSVDHETDKAIEFLRNRDKNKPFFLCVAYNPPHSPYENPETDCMEEDYNLYKDLPLSKLYTRKNADTTMAKAPYIRQYFANVSAVDRNFGRILDELKRLGLDKNTIVVFTADHGETMCSHSTPDPKNSIWTESFNVPFLIRWPEKLEHRTDSVLLSSVDIMPTLLSLSGRKIPESVEGKDLSKVFTGESNMRPKAALYLRNVNGEPDADGLYRTFFPIARGIKTDRYTFEISITKDYKIDKVSIYDDIADPYQMQNIDYKNNTDLFNELVSTLKESLKESNDTWYRENIIEKKLK